MINWFRDEFAFLSNFHLVKLTYGTYSKRRMGVPVEVPGVYSSVEHAFQAAKTLDLEMRYTVSMAPSARAAKVFGRQLSLRPEWEQKRLDIMRELLRLKFPPGSNLARMLILTDPESLEEGNKWHDNFWGRCHCPRCAGKGGQNWLGKMLMELRTSLLNKQNQEQSTA